MFFEDRSTDKLGVAYVRPSGNEAPSLWTAEDICAIYVRLITMGWLDPDRVSERTMDYYGRRLGHYGRLALAEREQRQTLAQHRQAVDEAFGTLMPRNEQVHPIFRDIVNAVSEGK